MSLLIAATDEKNIMQKKLLLISLLLFTLFFKASGQSSGLGQKQTELFKFHKYPSSNNVKFTVKARKKYKFSEPIKITLIWTNNSKSSEKIMIRDYWEHPIGVGVSITDLKTKKKLEKYNSTHILSSQLFIGKELEDYEIILKPNEVKTYTVDLRQIPYFDNTKLDRTKEIPKGKYSARISYYNKISTDFEFEVE